MELQQAILIATTIKETLAPHCDVINIAGSIRRGKTNPKDIEIVCLPSTRPILDVFGEEAGRKRTQDFVKAVEGLGVIEKGCPKEGRYLKIGLKQGIALDLFIPQPVDYYRQLAIRTGPSDYSHKVIATSWVKIGWCGTTDGLRKISDCKKKQNGNWVVVNKDYRLPPAWRTEKEFFEWLGVEFLEPGLRAI